VIRLHAVDTDALAIARRQAEDALSRADNAPTATARKEWEALARAWLELIAAIETLPAPARRAQNHE
jgi:hypothetical protein